MFCQSNQDNVAVSLWSEGRMESLDEGHSLNSSDFRLPYFRVLKSDEDTFVGSLRPEGV